MSQVSVHYIASLPFGGGLVGKGNHLVNPERAQFESSLAAAQHAVPNAKWLPVDCMDERPIVKLADGTTDASALAVRAAGSLPGGTVLATLKAAVAADAAFLREAKTTKQAYAITYELLQSFGIADAAHEGCGASNYVQESVTKPLSRELLLQTFDAVGANRETVDPFLQVLAEQKTRRVAAGFYDDWDPAWHAQFVRTRQPQNFSYLLSDDSPTHGHNASGVVLVAEGYYFAKNEFVAKVNGRQSFALTFGIADKIANTIGSNSDEMQRLKYAFRDDAFNVSNHIVATGLDVFMSTVE